MCQCIIVLNRHASKLNKWEKIPEDIKLSLIHYWFHCKIQIKHAVVTLTVQCLLFLMHIHGNPKAKRYPRSRATCIDPWQQPFHSYNFYSWILVFNDKAGPRMPDIEADLSSTLVSWTIRWKKTDLLIINMLYNKGGNATVSCRHWRWKRAVAFV